MNDLHPGFPPPLPPWQVNLHEVAMVRAVVRYLLQQGYGPGQVVVLTPYLGQLLELQKGLSETTQASGAAGGGGGVGGGREPWWT